MLSASIVAIVALVIVLLQLPNAKKSAGPEHGVVQATTTVPVPRGILSQPTVLQPLSGAASPSTTSAAKGTARRSLSPASAGPAGATTGLGSTPTGAASVTTPQNTVATVVYILSGSCTATASQYSCRVSVIPSNGLVSAGYISVFPASNHDQECHSLGPLIRNDASLNGTCTFPYSSKVLALYSLNTDAQATRLAAAYIPWG